MKTLLINALVLFSAATAVAQSPSMQTLFSGDKKSTTSVTAYGAAPAKLTRFANSPALLTGVYGGVLLNHRLMIGAGGYGLTTNVFVPNEQVNGQRLRWEMNYYGLVLEYINSPHRLVHLTGNILAGGGYVNKNIRSRNDWDLEKPGFVRDRSFFYAVEPSLGVEVNTFRWMRVAVGGSYRFIFDSKTDGITDKEMSAPAGHVTLKFGKF